MFWISVLILALFIGSWPAYGASVSPGFKVLCSYTPSVYASELLQQYFWISIAALLLLLALEHFEPLQRPFTSALAIYAGDISFGLYIVHWPLLLTFGRGIFPSMIKIFSKEGADIGFQNYPVGWWIGAMIFTPIVVWVADIHWRGADIQSVKFARWLFLVCAKKNGRT
jgi:peptidoglycan/LPS O-acetylase OafA/YrhL